MHYALTGSLFGNKVCFFFGRKKFRLKRKKKKDQA